MSSQRRESSSEHNPMHTSHEAKRQGLVRSWWCRWGRFEHAPTGPALFHVPRRTLEEPGVQRRSQRLTQLGLIANRVSYSSPLPRPRQSTLKGRLCTGAKATRYEALCPSQGQKDIWYASTNGQHDDPFPQMDDGRAGRHHAADTTYHATFWCMEIISSELLRSGVLTRLAYSASVCPNRGRAQI